MDRSPAEQELNRIERELDVNEPSGGKPPVKRGVVRMVVVRVESQATDPSVTALLMVAVAASLVFAGQLSKDQCMQLTAGSVGGSCWPVAGLWRRKAEALRPPELSASSPRRYPSERVAPDAVEPAVTTTAEPEKADRQRCSRHSFGGESPLSLDPRVASASLQCHNTNIATSRQVGEPCHRFSSGASAAAFTTPFPVHLYLQEANEGNGGVAAR